MKVGDADRHLNEVQTNVSTKINFISAELYSTVKDLNEAVMDSMYVCTVCTVCTTSHIHFRDLPYIFMYVCMYTVYVYDLELTYIIYSIYIITPTYIHTIQYIYVFDTYHCNYVIIYVCMYVCMYVC